MSTIKVAVAQFNSTPDPDENLELVRDFAFAAAEHGVQLLVFPEATMACFGTKLGEVAQPLDGPFASSIVSIAAERRLFIVAGMFTPGDDDRVRNTVIATGGEGLAHYDKIHMFDAFNQKESDHVQPGSELIIVDALGAKIGLSTCFDVRFADQFTALGRAGADIICLPASWAAGPGKVEQWEMLIRARAHDAQAWLIAADQAYTKPRGKAALGVGVSAVIDPRGAIAAKLGPEAGLLMQEIDLDLVAKVRAELPIL